MAQSIPYRTAYGPRHRVQVLFTDLSLTKQSAKDECDINRIMSRFAVTGAIEHLNRHHGDFGNFIGYSDYQTSLNQIIDAQQMFDDLPAKVRTRFGNNPAAFLEFAQNSDNVDELISLGLAHKRARPANEDAQQNPAETPDASAAGAEG